MKLWKYHWGPKLSWGPPFEGASVLRGLQGFSAEALRGNSFSILSLHRKQSYQSSAGVRVYLAGNMCILTYCLYAAFIPISGRLLATPISGKGGGLLQPPLKISGSYRSIFKIQTAFVSPEHDLHF